MNQIPITDLNDKYRILDTQATEEIKINDRKPVSVCECLRKIYEKGCKAKNEKNYDLAYIMFKRWIFCVNWLREQKLPKGMKNKFFPDDKVTVVENLLDTVSDKIKFEYVKKPNELQINNDRNIVAPENVTKKTRRPSKPDSLNSPFNASYEFLNVNSQHEKTSILTDSNFSESEVVGPSNSTSKVSVKELLDLWESRSAENFPKSNKNLLNSQRRQKNGNSTEFLNSTSPVSAEHNMNDTTITDLDDKYRQLDIAALRPNLEGRRPSAVCENLSKLYDKGYIAKHEKDYEKAYIFFKRWISCVNWLLDQQLDKDTISKFVSNETVKNVINLLEEVSNIIKLNYETKAKKFNMENNNYC